MGNPARVVFELAALLAFVAHVRAPSWRTGLAGLLAFAASLTGHESAMLLPGLLGAWIVDGFRGSGPAFGVACVLFAALAIASISRAVMSVSRTSIVVTAPSLRGAQLLAPGLERA